jgi:hypothetical protein
LVIDYLIELNGHPKQAGDEAAAAGDVYFPGGWQADIRELPEGLTPDRFAWF